MLNYTVTTLWCCALLWLLLIKNCDASMLPTEVWRPILETEILSGYKDWTTIETVRG